MVLCCPLFVLCGPLQYLVIPPSSNSDGHLYSFFPENGMASLKQWSSSFQSRPLGMTYFPHNTSPGYSAAYCSVGSRAPTLRSLRMSILYFILHCTCEFCQVIAITCTRYYLMDCLFLDEPPAVRLSIVSLHWILFYSSLFTVDQKGEAEANTAQCVLQWPYSCPGLRLLLASVAVPCMLCSVKVLHLFSISCMRWPPRTHYLR